MRPRPPPAGYKAVIEELPLPADYTGPNMTTDLTVQARTRPARSRACSAHTAHAQLSSGLSPPPASPHFRPLSTAAGRGVIALTHQGARGA